MFLRMLRFPKIICPPVSRADFGARFVVLEKDCVRIERLYAGIVMRLSVPLRQFAGVLLALAADGSIRLSLLHRDPDLCVLLREYADDADVLADFSCMARTFSLPRFVEPQAGQRICLDVCFGALVCGRVPALRRRGIVAVKRRPRFLMRRRIGERCLMKPLLR